MLCRSLTDKKDAMKRMEVEIYVEGQKARIDLARLDYASLYKLFRKLRYLLGEGDFVLSAILDEELIYLEDELPRKPINILLRNGISTVADLLAASDSELAAMDGLGRKSLSEIREFIRKMGNIVIG